MNVHEILATHAEKYAVVDRLHDVPPHDVYEVDLDGQRAVLKVGTGPRADPAVEGHVSGFVARETSVPAPEVVAVGENYFIAKWLDGTPAEGKAVDELKARTMGAGLARLHEETTFDATGFPAAGDDGMVVTYHANWAETVEAFLEDLRGYLANAKPEYEPVAADVIAFVREQPEVFAVPGEPVLCHGNYLPEHVGIDRERAAGSSAPDPGAVTAVVDFEHALVAPAAYDYWRSAFPIRNEKEGPLVTAFREGYESVRPLPNGIREGETPFALVIMVEYFQSLFLQGNVTGEEAEQRGDRMADWIRETLADHRAKNI